MVRSLLALLILVVLQQQPARADDTSITLRSDLWCPYACQPNSAAEGVLVDIARSAFGKAGYHVDYQLLNWARAVDDTREGQYDGVIGALHNDAPDFIFPDEMLAASRNCFYTRPQDAWAPTSDLEDSLKQRRLGVANAYSYGPVLDHYIDRHRSDNSRIDILSGDDLFQRNLEKLHLGRIDTLVEDHWVAAYGLKQTGSSDSVRQAGCMSSVAVYIAFSPAHPGRSRSLASILSMAVRTMRRNGELDKLLARYGVR